MRALVAFVLATLVFLAMLPVTVVAMEPVGEVAIEDAMDLTEHGDSIDEEEPGSPALDDDVLHDFPLVCAPCQPMHWSPDLWHPLPEGRVPSRSRRPPRAR